MLKIVHVSVDVYILLFDSHVNTLFENINIFGRCGAS